MSDRIRLVKKVVRDQAKLRAAGKAPTWESLMAEGQLRGQDLDPSQVEEFERLWRIIHQVCPKGHDPRVTDYLLVCLAKEGGLDIKPNHAAFNLTDGEARTIHKAIESNS